MIRRTKGNTSRMVLDHPYCYNLISLKVTDDVATIPSHISLCSAALREYPKSIPVHWCHLPISSFVFLSFLLLSLFLKVAILSLLLPSSPPCSFHCSCRIVFVMPEGIVMYPYYLNFRFFTMVRRSSRTPVAFWILLRTSPFATGLILCSLIKLTT